MSQIRDHRTRALSYGGHEFVTIVRKGLRIKKNSNKGQNIIPMEYEVDVEMSTKI